MGSGGAPSGTIKYPDYVQEMHARVLAGGTVTAAAAGVKYWSNIDGVISQLQADEGNSPYASMNAEDPNAVLALTTDSPMKRMWDAWTSLDTVAGALTTNAGFAAAFAGAIEAPTALVQAALDSISNDVNGAIADQVTEYTTQVTADRAREIGSFGGGMVDINATNGSAFITGMAMLEEKKSHLVNKFREDLKRQYFDTFVKAFINILGTGIQAENASAQLGIEMNRLFIAALREQQERDDELDVLDMMFPYDLYQVIGNVLGSPGSSSYVPKLPSRGQSMLSTGLAGASIGVEAGSVAGGIGAGAGGVIGGIAGLLAGAIQ